MTCFHEHSLETNCLSVDVQIGTVAVKNEAMSAIRKTYLHQIVPYVCSLNVHVLAYKVFNDHR